MTPLPRLIALSPGDLAGGDHRAFLAAVRRALAAGLPGLLLREPRLSDREFLALGRELTGLRQLHPSLWFAVHDRAHLAAELGADAVHLSFRSLRPAELRPWLDPCIALGLSTHAHDDPGTWEAADYLFHGPLRATPSKAALVEPVGLDGLERALARTRRPLFALGGVRPEDVAEVQTRGAHGVAVLAGILRAEDAAEATRAYLAALAGMRARRE